MDVARLDRLAAGVRHVVIGEPEPVPALGVDHAGEVEDLGRRVVRGWARRRTSCGDRSLLAVTDDLWEAHADWWIDGFTEGADPEYVEQILPMALDELSGFGRVLDVGCGDGQISRILAAAGCARRGHRSDVEPDPHRARA